MCGIAGRFHPRHLEPAPAWRGEVDRLLAHRGPDGSGHYRDDLCELVHRRLSIVDLSATGDQPLWNEDQNVAVVFNGEIYNHRELRARLQAHGHVFRGTSDTEVLVHLYEDEGDEMLAQLRGMFALAVYDRRRRRLLLGRDPFGIKPLYFAASRKELIFASEIKAILPRFEARIDRQACYDFLGLGYVPEPATGFEGLRALPPGSLLAVSAAGQRSGSFHDLRARPSGSGELAEAAERVATSILRAVDRQRVADVPVAGMVSGGIDSSLVAAAFSRGCAQPAATFNVRFPGHEFDETRLARAVSRHLGTDHHTVDLRDWVVTPEEVADLLAHFDQPFADMSLLPTHLLAKAIRESGFKCALSGDGGDEVFGGYPQVWQIVNLRRLARFPGWLLRIAALAGHILARGTTDAGRRIRKASQLARLGRHQPSILMAGLSSYLTEEEKRDLVRPEARDGLEPVYRHFADPGVSRDGRTEDLSAHVTENFFRVRLPSDMLKKVDMMSMLAGLETRVPLLDEELVELGLALPHALKTNGREGKLVLRAVVRNWLPEVVATHPKHGFDIPAERMVTGSFHEMLDHQLLGADSRVLPFVRGDLVAEWLLAFRNRAPGAATSRGGLTQRVFNLLALELCMRRHGLSW